ncbi:hypothetical protein DSL92_05370 [Billgrantia gudaonensis]|uniref:Uncharacterized protein n=1 Tax=Billgrantia gudaonensis TaxID=376427 RepID=A0A3S0Q165_9GAMM|nr:hypothetical protein DSL92_05370 [Halomonas gudaonensis]
MPLALLYVTARSVPSRVAALLCLPPLVVVSAVRDRGGAGILALVSAMAVAVSLFGRQARFPWPRCWWRRWSACWAGGSTTRCWQKGPNRPFSATSPPAAAASISGRMRCATPSRTSLASAR